MAFNTYNVNQMGYSLYNEYNQRYLENALKYAKMAGLPVRYFHINIDESKNYDDETSIQVSYKYSKFDLYEFIPVIDMSPPTQQTSFDNTEQGTSYTITMSMTIVGVPDPLPGDLLTFYNPTGNALLDQYFSFRVKNIEYLNFTNQITSGTLSSNDGPRIPIYRIELQNAPYKSSSISNIIENNIINHYYFNSDTGELIDGNNVVYLEFLQNNIDSISTEISELYDATNSTYKYCKFNSVIRFIQKKYNNFNKIIMNKCFEMDIRDFLAAFDKLTIYKNLNPITNETIYTKESQIDDQNSSNINEIQYVQDLDNYNSETINEDNIENIDIEKSDDKIDLLIEFYDFTITNNDCSTEPVLIFKIYEDEDGIHEEYSDEFKYYYDIYKILFAYRQTDVRFFDWTNISCDEIRDVSGADDSLFYNYLGVLTPGYFESYTEVLYDPGYYLSYQDGPVQFNTTSDSTIGLS